MFRQDINMRACAVLGLVGTGGIGVTLDDAINISQWDGVSTILLTIPVVAPIPKVVVIALRRRLIRLASRGTI